MHIILGKHVEEIAEDYEHSDLKQSKQFEMFCNYCLTSKHFFGRFDPLDITTDEDDAAIDGIAVVIDGDLVATVDDAEAIFGTHKTSLPVDVVVVQAKSGEQFKKSDISNFSMGIADFLSLEPKLPQGKLLVEAGSILKVVLNNLKKVKGRRPNIHVYYCTSGVYAATRELDAAFKIIERSVQETELFSSVSVQPFGRAELLKLYAATSEKNEADLKVIDYLGIPAMPGIPQSYVALVNARAFVDELIFDDEKNIRQSVFEENVRSYLGADNEVNSAIRATLRDSEKCKLFSVLNNGITVVAPQLTLTPNTKELHLTNYQIINGCQTSSTLAENHAHLSDAVNVVVRFIESPENDSASDVIAATNNQSDISKEAFLALRNKAKLVQKYFAAKNQEAATQNRIYFERRQAEYRTSGYQATRIFDIKTLARCFTAMFLDTPHNAARYVATIFASGAQQLFREEDTESYYYVAALALYKYQTLINGNKIRARNYIKLRWHIIQAFKWLAAGTTDTPEPNSKKADSHAMQIARILTSDANEYVDIFEECQDIVDKVGQPTDDALKRARFSQEMLAETKLRIANKTTSSKRRKN
jgi:hypothetical protein